MPKGKGLAIDRRGYLPDIRFLFLILGAVAFGWTLSRWRANDSDRYDGSLFRPRMLVGCPR